MITIVKQTVHDCHSRIASLLLDDYTSIINKKMKYAYFESPLPYVNMRKIDAIDFKALAYHLCSMHILLEFTLEHGK